MPPAGYPTYPAYGTGFTVGGQPIVYGGSIIPTALVPSFLLPGDNGFITVDWNKVKAATGYDRLLAGATETGSGTSGANGGLIREKVTGTFIEGNGIIDVNDTDTLRVNAGVRYVRTQQIVGGRTSIPDPRNTRGGVTCPGSTANKLRAGRLLLSGHGRLCRDGTASIPTSALGERRLQLRQTRRWRAARSRAR